MAALERCKCKSDKIPRRYSSLKKQAALTVFVSFGLNVGRELSSGGEAIHALLE
ncbi:MAG: hypothetical protein ABH863_00510 [Candidatus Micrarchaeota archaeon]